MQTASSISMNRHDLPPLIVLSAELHVCCHNSHFNCDNNSQGTNHKAETENVVEVALQSSQNNLGVTRLNFLVLQILNTGRGAIHVSTAHCSANCYNPTDLPDGCHGEVQLDKYSSERQQTSGCKQHVGVAGPVWRWNVSRNLIGTCWVSDNWLLCSNHSSCSSMPINQRLVQRVHNEAAIQLCMRSIAYTRQDKERTTP